MTETILIGEARGRAAAEAARLPTMSSATATDGTLALRIRSGYPTPPCASTTFARSRSVCPGRPNHREHRVACRRARSIGRLSTGKSRLGFRSAAMKRRRVFVETVEQRVSLQGRGCAREEVVCDDSLVRVVRSSSPKSAWADCWCRRGVEEPPRSSASCQHEAETVCRQVSYGFPATRARSSSSAFPGRAPVVRAHALRRTHAVRAYDRPPPVNERGPHLRQRLRTRAALPSWLPPSRTSWPHGVRGSG